VVFPDFNRTDLASNTVSVSAYKGKVVLVDFWATWCPPCLRAMPGLAKAYDKYHSQGFEIIGVNEDQDQESLESFVAKYKIKWPQIFDNASDLPNSLTFKYGASILPATYLLDREGKIIAANLRGEALELAIDEAMKPK
jgi:thiol-disulfide isomerase/thioredoxin